MSRITALTLSLLTAGLLAGSPAAFAQAAEAKPATKVTKAAPTKKPVVKKRTASQSRKQLPPQAHAAALATDVSESISPTQLQIADRVLTGTAQCEFNQTVSVDAVKDKPGHFTVAYNKAAYVMTPQETSTGAVRLEDRRNGIVWLQIPSKSMMMNHKAGQRMVDDCTHAEQRAALGGAASH